MDEEKLSIAMIMLIEKSVIVYFRYIAPLRGVTRIEVAWRRMHGLAYNYVNNEA